MRRHVEIEERFELHDPWLRPPHHMSTLRPVDFSRELYKRTLGEPLVGNARSTPRLVESLAIPFDRQFLRNRCFVWIATRISGSAHHSHVNPSQRTGGIRLQRHEAWIVCTKPPPLPPLPPTHLARLRPSPDTQPSNETSGTYHAPQVEKHMPRF